jgi:dTDP-glucose pyrophosphorylase
MSKRPLEPLCIPPDCTIRTAIASIDRGGLGIALIVDSDRHLVGTISDGDVRRAMLDSIDLEQAVSVLLSRKSNTQYSKPIAAKLGDNPEMLMALMMQYSVHVIPVLDEAGILHDLVAMDDLIPGDNLPVQAVIMAGGFGSRLRPLTEDMPKPMLPVGGRPVMEVLLEQLQQAGIRQVNVTTHYLPEKITEHFGDGKAFGVEINYVNEEKPLGTGGALGLLPQPVEPMLVVNGDVLTRVNFRSMLAFHQENHADLTVAVRQYDVEIPFGVIESDGVLVKSVREKPRLSHFVNAGIYLLDPGVYQFIPNGEHFNMTDLIQWLIDAGRRVVCFPVSEYWLDIGQHADYVRAQNDMETKFGDEKKAGQKIKKERKLKTS